MMPLEDKCPSHVPCIKNEIYMGHQVSIFTACVRSTTVGYLFIRVCRFGGGDPGPCAF